MQSYGFPTLPNLDHKVSHPLDIIKVKKYYSKYPVSCPLTHQLQIKNSDSNWEDISTHALGNYIAFDNSPKMVITKMPDNTYGDQTFNFRYVSSMYKSAHK